MDGYEKRDIVELLEEDGVDLIAVHFPGRPEPQYYKGLCPLHDDSNPSFCVYPTSQKWVCWACSARSDDVIAYFMQRYNWSFNKARDHCCTKIDEKTLMKRRIDKLKADKADSESKQRLTKILRNRFKEGGFDSVLDTLRITLAMQNAKKSVMQIAETITK